MAKWIPITENYLLDKRAIVTRKAKGLDVTIGLAGWGLQNGTIAYMPLPENITKAPELWKSEYRGDDPPKRRGSYIVQLQGILPHNRNWLNIHELYYAVKSSKWLAVPMGWEVIAWMKLPKPYTGNNTQGKGRQQWL